MSFLGALRKSPLFSGLGRRSYTPPLSVSSMNRNMLGVQYEVRGVVPQQARRIQAELQNGSTEYPFKDIIFANIGDMHAMGQTPITFARQVLSLCMFPDQPDGTFPPDVHERAKNILDACSGRSIGSYTDSAGLALVRQDVCNYLEKRDGRPVDLNRLFLIAGASQGIRVLLQFFMNGSGQHRKKPAIMVPVPQYPLYSATLTELGAHRIDYYLDESLGWKLSVDNLYRLLEENKDEYETLCLVVINPGNPTGQVLTKDNMKDVLHFCQKNNVFLLADEVYQDNVYNSDRRCYSFKTILNSMGDEFKDFQMAAFDSTSKGFLGECGFRGGFMEVVGFEDDLLAQLRKIMNTKLCPGTTGQIAVSCEVNPPKEGDPSYAVFKQEKDTIMNSLVLRAEIVRSRLNAVEGISCNPVEGAMYAFPNITIPPKAIKEAESRDLSADTFYCLELLNETGVCVVPGCGFNQAPGTYHFRTTILPPEDLLTDMMDRIERFHNSFTQRYS
ncbi:alanine aminotransferase 2-like [Sycon ciliatum]|uniref:alanine aminotransferase 2-like n=1 Tax=Sycon ciliatum TaxID=27933 RepID=UPI0020A951D0|eukprot:scpid69472/ scgid31819/ Alanine aminotransferase 2; Glutamate pyruvate transaminase 2; Glutamic--alanine transaminase 2; Glutamic--pyruvic transaminase 2